MDRRTFLKVVGAGLAVPSALIKAKSKPPSKIASERAISTDGAATLASKHLRKIPQ